MNQPTNGLENSKQYTAREFLTKKEEYLNESNKNIGFKIPTQNIENIEKILSFDSEEIRKLSTEDIYIYVQELQRYIFSLELEIARNNNRISISDREIIKVLSKQYNNYGDKYSKFEVIKYLFLKDNTHAAEFENIAHHCKIKNSELEVFRNFVNKTCDLMINLAKSKTYQK